jgi:hypothetical protein
MRKIISFPEIRIGFPVDCLQSQKIVKTKFTRLDLKKHARYLEIKVRAINIDKILNDV